MEANVRESCRDSLVLLAFLAVPLIGFLAPRFLAYWPAIVGLLSIAGFVVIQRQRPVIDWKLMGLLFMPVVLGAVSLIWAQDFDASFERVQKLGLLLFGGALFLTSLQFYSAPDLGKYLKFFSIAVMAFAVFIGVELLTDMRFYRFTHGIDDINQPINPSKYNRAAIVVLFSGFVFFCVALKQKAWWPMVGIILPLLFMTALSESQSLQLALIVGLLSVLIFNHNQRAQWYIFYGMVVIFTLGFPFLVLWAFQFAHQLDTMFFFEQASAGPRLEVWDYVFRYALENVWTGFGIEVTRTVEDFDSAEIFQGGTSILHPHNFAIQFWIEFGLLGVFVFLSYFFYLIKRLEKASASSSTPYVIMPLLVMFLTISATGYGVWQSWWIGLILMSVGLVQHLLKAKSI